LIFKIISFDLFNTLVYLNGGETSRKKILYSAYKSFNKYYPQTKFLNFYKVYMEAWKDHLKIKPPYLEKKHVKLMACVLKKIIIGIKSEDLNLMAKKATKKYFYEIINYIKLYPYVKDILSDLSNKYPLVLISDHSYAKNGYDVLKKFELNRFFDKIIFSEEIGYRKPSKIIFNEAFQGYSLLDKRHILHIGDMYQNDVIGITEFGGNAVWIQHKKNIDENIKPYDKKKIFGIINKLEDIYHYIN